ncbi:MAG TPA: stage II sporulation protein M [Candidatus Nanoarchaeia archaeon]|nr:stage II sporulation protein M [Candidatus Nanoarchaeia archaeon]
MVLESLIDPQTAKQKPLKLFLLGLLFSSMAVLFSLWVFKAQTSLIMVFLTVVVSVPLMYATIEEEEEEDWREDSEKTILVEHSKAILFLTCLFLGFVVSFSMWFIFLPQNTVNMMFNTQLATIESINSNVIKIMTAGTINYGLGLDTFLSILSNNVKVLIFCVFFAFFFGAGSIFILTWNASVISAAMGTYFRNLLGNYAGFFGFNKVAVYLHIFSLSLMRYMVHGVFEIVAYFIGGLAGGIISVGIINHGANTKKFKNIMFDALVLLLIAVGLLLVGALVEVFITPQLF